MSRHHFGGHDLISLAERKGGRDMGMTSQPGLLNLGSRHHFEVVTWLVQLGGGTKSRPRFEVATWVGQCEVATWTLFRSLFGHCSWTLFMNTIHRG